MRRKEAGQERRGFKIQREYTYRSKQNKMEKGREEDLWKLMNERWEGGRKKKEVGRKVGREEGIEGGRER